MTDNYLLIAATIAAVLATATALLALRQERKSQPPLPRPPEDRDKPR